jgi:hypothetical protein
MGRERVSKVKWVMPSDIAMDGWKKGQMFHVQCHPKEFSPFLF